MVCEAGLASPLPRARPHKDRQRCARACVGGSVGCRRSLLRSRSDPVCGVADPVTSDMSDILLLALASAPAL